ncbi:hypothetical protein N8G13_03260 [Mycoplasma zalophi]|uniref:hypothetical protein n=1 Tax=Mycoplasma zalophi TaxID=191287 RepID=UPI0021C9ED26|nr:hypothetical protein [Mycoplasma zalophi]MCU4117458.1 hypothetical protein [Mycoplasma zalophi]
MKKTKFLAFISLTVVAPFILVACAINNQNNPDNLTNKTDDNNLNTYTIPSNNNSNLNNNKNDFSDSTKDNNGDEMENNHNDSSANSNETNNDSKDDLNSLDNNQSRDEPKPNKNEIDGKKELQITKSATPNLEATSNSVTYYLEIKNFEEIYSENLSIQVKLISKTDLYNAEIFKSKDKLLLKINFDNLNENTSYKLEKLEISSANKLISIDLVDKDFSFVTLKENKEATDNVYLESNLVDSDRVLVNSLQQANSYSNNDQNININISDLSKKNLVNNPAYSVYFSELDKTFENEITSNISLESNLPEIVFDNKIDSNDSVQFTFQNLNNLNSNNIEVLVKGWDGKDIWTKWLQVQKTSNGITLQKNQLNKYLNKYVVTAIKDTQNQYKVLLNNNNIFLNNANLNNLKISHFNVYKDENNKDIFGTLMLNWTNEQANLLRNKIFVLTFETKQKEYIEKSHIIPAKLFELEKKIIDNEHEKIDDKNRVQRHKKVYVNFENLWKFKLNGLQEKIEYRLKSVSVQNKNEYFDITKPILPSESYYFSFNFDWNNPYKLNNLLINDKDYEELKTYNFVTNEKNISKSTLFNNHNTTKNKIPFSIHNLGQLINYNYEVHTIKTLYKNRKKYLPANDNDQEFVNYQIVKNNYPFDLNWFKTKDYLSAQLFKINENKTQAIITKNLNSIIKLDSIPSEDVIFWLTFELNPNPQIANHWSEFNDVDSRVTIPISYKNLKKYKTLNDVEFMYNFNSEDNKFQTDIAKKIKSLLAFNLELNDNKELTLKIKVRDLNTKINNTVWNHNSSSERSIYISTADLFVNWIQQPNKEKILSFKEVDKVDNLSIQTTSTAYNNSYELKYSTKERDNLKIDNYLEDEINPDDINKRLFIEDNSEGIQQGRQRVYSLSKKSDGSWNILAKVNDDPNDYRFWTFANYHVWVTNKSANSNLAKVSTSKNGNEILTIKKGEIIAPTLISKDTLNKKEPIFYQPDNDKNINVVGNMYEFNFQNTDDAITYEMIVDFSNNYTNIFDSFKNNLGEIQIREPHKETVKNNSDKTHKEQQKNRADLVIAIVDFQSIFKKFRNKDLTKEIDGKLLTKREQGAINHILNFANLKPLKFSKLSRYMNSFNNLNAYVASLPKVPTKNRDGEVESSRYREYLYGINSIRIDFSDVEKFSKSYNAALYSDIKYFDLYSGSSGSAVYDYEGKLLGFIEQGTAARINNFIFTETQKYSYFGNDDTNLNPGTFYSITKKLNYLYPMDFKKLFN